MSLSDATYALDELAAGRLPELERAYRGLEALDPLLLQGGREQALHEASAILELLVATGGSVSMLIEARRRAGEMSDAVRRLTTDD